MRNHPRLDPKTLLPGIVIALVGYLIVMVLKAF